MNVRNGNKLNRLERELPEGLLVDAGWLEARGYSRSLRSQYVRSGWLEQPVRGVFRRPRGVLGWEQVVISMQTLLGLPVSVGGRSALELQGYAHYLSHSISSIHLYSDGKLPGWVAKLPMDVKFIVHNRARFLPPVEMAEGPSLESGAVSAPEASLPGALRIERWGQWKWPMMMSSPERAILELLDELPTDESFHNADMIMEGLAGLSPRRLQRLLEQCRSVKVKRLFFFFADRHRHKWLDRIEKSKINLGSGKRMLVKGGKLDPVYQVTVPEELDGF
ncbi:type IV toxin-antitoxin system AbiEi family antitoxin [Marinobacterium sp. AK62]|uniref:Type IV toxin-antitoxin system AbiEi family antitoxin n=1 Tax=Marinobacterium alkalitolerans TaxID=1542925 RepID=A0ABS3ZDR7_9GAMM|nr:type IV toxin-antitoxin system AbiEi family antitoxin [Marinobacterium alkalitolerans]MBP0049852.1 type IV toxin-antitoxin system AbiEi family antitoxin [Marinobacterium alkalitolerans]